MMVRVAHPPQGLQLARMAHRNRLPKTLGHPAQWPNMHVVTGVSSISRSPKTVPGCQNGPRNTQNTTRHSPQTPSTRQYPDVGHPVRILDPRGISGTFKGPSPTAKAASSTPPTANPCRHTEITTEARTASPTDPTTPWDGLAATPRRPSASIKASRPSQHARFSTTERAARCRDQMPSHTRSLVSCTITPVPWANPGQPWAPQSPESGHSTCDRSESQG